MNKDIISINEIITRWDGGGFYRFDGEIYNGVSCDENGQWQPYICHETVSRRVNFVDTEKGIIHCECGREFIINDKLKVTKCGY